MPVLLYFIIGLIVKDFYSLYVRKIFIVFMTIYIAIINIIRMKKEGFSNLYILKSYIPFYGMFIRYSSKKK
jgi:hypothetical protein